MKAYKKRIADDILRQRLEARGAILLEGAKWCGKTSTAAQIAKSVLYMQDPAETKQYFAMMDMNPLELLKGKTPRLIDEWQLAPRLWDAVRFEVDQRGEFGQFILTGSAVPADISQIMHTGTGRIARMMMRPMTLLESGESTGQVSLGALFEGETDISGKTDMELDELAFVIARGGWPQALGRSDSVALQQAADYFDAVVNMDISRVDDIERNPDRAVRLLRAYARSIGTQIKFASIARDIEANEASRVSDATVYSYISALKKIFVLEESPAWTPNLRSKTPVRTTETRYFTDPSIAVAAMGLGPRDLMKSLHTMGFFFENMAVRDLRVYAEAIGGKVYHFLDKNALECDAVVHLRNGAYGLIEVKLGGERLIEEGAKSLERLASKLDITRMNPPAFKMVLTGLGPYAYKRKADDVLVVPLACLRP